MLLFSAWGRKTVGKFGRTGSHNICGVSTGVPGLFCRVSLRHAWTWLVFRELNGSLSLFVIGIHRLVVFQACELSGVDSPNRSQCAGPPIGDWAIFNLAYPVSHLLIFHCSPTVLRHHPRPQEPKGGRTVPFHGVEEWQECRKLT